MRRLVFALFCLPLLPMSGQAAAQPDNGELTGVWQGKLGNSEITACFNFPSTYDNKGNYYYARHKTSINLSQPEGKKPWVESVDAENRSGSWELSKPQDGKLGGVWHHPSNGKTLPISLILVRPPAGKEEPCSSTAYNLALETFPALTTSRPMYLDKRKDVSFRSLRIADSITVELTGPGKGVPAINKQLREELPKNMHDMADYFERRRNFLGTYGIAMDDEVHAEPTFWSTRYVTVNFYRWAAGMGRNGISMRFRTWDLQSGKEVDVWRWFGSKSEEGSYDMSALPLSLRQTLFKGVTVSDDCKTDYMGRGLYHLSLTDTGVKFWEEAYGSGCEQEFSLSYAKIRPFLTVEGKAALLP